MKIASRLRGAISALPIHMLALMAAFAMLLCACGGNTKSLQTPALSPSAPSGSGIPLASAQDTSAQVAEVLAAQAPEGVDAELWDMLRDELARELAAKASSQASEELPEWNQNGFECLSDYDVDNGYRSVTWNTRFFRGDGNQNGVIDIGDLVLIAQHFGQRSTDSRYTELADYNRDYAVNIADITVLAKNFDKTCASFKVELSLVSRRTGYSMSTIQSHDDFSGANSKGFLTYEYTFPQGIPPVAWVRVIACDSMNREIDYDTCVLKHDTGGHPYFPINDLFAPDPQFGFVAWSSKFFAGDGDADGAVESEETYRLSSYLGLNLNDNPHVRGFDYDRDGIISLLDFDSFYDHQGERCYGFLVEVSTEGPNEGFIEDGRPTWDECFSAYPNPVDYSGFAFFSYMLFSPPEGIPYWVRVTPMGYGSDFGVPSDAVMFGGE